MSNHESATIADYFTKNFICNFGIPHKILTDQGTDFCSSLFKDVAKLFKIQKLQTTAYHPQTNGALERSHATLADYLKHYITPEQIDWDDWLPFAIFSYNATPHSATNFCPHELVYGNKPSLPSSLSTTEFKYT